MLIAGVDEAGRGPLAGPVYAAAVILDPALPLVGLRDSKKLSARRREQLFDEIAENSLAWAIATAQVDEIDRINILQASLLAMKRAVTALTLMPELVRVDGNRIPDLPFRAEAIIGGDACHAEISAASILAKVARDRHMVEQHVQYPEYGFSRHKGYPTRDHLEVLRRIGPCKIHRRSYLPVQQADIFSNCR